MIPPMIIQPVSVVLRTRPGRCIFLLSLALFLAFPVFATAADFDSLRAGGSARVTAVVDGDTVVLDDGREVRFVGIQAPKLPLGRLGFQKWPFADEAKLAVAGLAQGKQLTLYHGGRDTDRHGRVLAHLVNEDGVWLQGDLLRRGFARVYSFADNRALVPEMLILEAEARTARRGIWRLDYYAITPQADAARRIGQFALIEGIVIATATVRGRGFVNFGTDYKTDFTASIAPRDLRGFVREGIDIAGYEGRNIRIRGWVKSYNGPMIEVTHPEQIEELDR
jgi:endonuclease YncB( thermonuclease family)